MNPRSDLEVPFPNLKCHQHPESETVASRAFFSSIFEELFDTTMFEDALLFDCARREDIADVVFHFLLHPEVNGHSHSAFGAMDDGVGKASGEGSFYDYLFLPPGEFALGGDCEAEPDDVFIKERRKWAEIMCGKHALYLGLDEVGSFEPLVD